MTPKNSRGLRYQENLVASLKHETVRLHHTETFRAFTPHSFMGHVNWRCLAGTTLSHVCFEPNFCYVPVPSTASPFLALLYTIQHKNVSFLCRILCNCGYRGFASSNVVGFPTFWESLQLPVQGECVLQLCIRRSKTPSTHSPWRW
jgi:hypothetical protein